MGLMNNVEQVAQTTAALLEIDWETCDEDMKRRLRATAFRLYEQTMTTFSNGLQEAVDAIHEAIEDNALFKKEIPGALASVKIIQDVIEEMKEDLAFKVEDHVPDGLTRPDPYAEIEAGDEDPYVPFRLLRDFIPCNDEHPEGWTCTRSQHSPTWLHFDADPSVSQRVLAVWEHDSETLLSVDTSFATFIEDDDSED